MPRGLRRATSVIAVLSASCNAIFGIHQLEGGDASVADARARDASVDRGGSRCVPTLDAAAPAPMSCTSDGWCWLSPALPGFELTGVSGVCGDVWAVGFRGAVLHRIGTVWGPAASPTTADLETVARVAENDVWVGDGVGALHHFDGARWKSYPSDAGDAGGAVIWSVWGTATDDVWAAGTAGSRAIVMHWDGSAWAHDALEDKTQLITNLSGTSSDDLWAAGNDLFHRTGGAWTRATGMPAGCTFPSIFADAPGSAWTICSQNDIAGSLDASISGSFNGTSLFHGGGSNWTAVDAGLASPGLGPGVPQILWGSSAGDVWLLGDVESTPFPILFGHYDGARWRQTSMVPGVVTPAFGASTGPEESFLVGSPGAILHAVGASTLYEDPAFGTNVAAIAGTSPDDVWLVGSAAGGADGGSGTNVLHFDGTGLTPRPIADAASASAAFVPYPPALDDAGAVIPSAWVVGASAAQVPQAWRWDNPSAAWVASAAFPSGATALRGVAGGSDGSLFAVGDGPAVYGYDGTSWIPALDVTADGGVAPGSASLLAIAGDGFGAYWAVGTMGIVATRTVGAPWTVRSPLPRADTLTSVAVDPTSGAVWAAGLNATGGADVFVLRRGATAWQPVAAPSEDLGNLPSLSSPKLWVDGNGTPWMLGASAAVFKGGGADAGSWTPVGPSSGAATGAIWGTADSSVMLWVAGLNTIRYLKQ